MKNCQVSGCKNKHHGKGYCKTHYTKFVSKTNTTKCSVLECYRIVGKNGAKGYCNKHYNRYKESGDPAVLKKKRTYQSFISDIKSKYPDTYLDFNIATTQHWARICKAHYGDKCSICGWCKTTCDVDHVIPRKEGGLNTINNGKVLCPNCHAEKHRSPNTC